MTGSNGTGRAQRRRCLPCVPPGGRSGEARRSVRSNALPSRRGAGTAPGSPAVRGGSPAAQRPFERGCTDRSAGGCADRRTFSTTRVRALRGLDVAEASPRRCASWRSCGRWWRGPSARATARPCRLSAVPASPLTAARPGVPWKPLVREPLPPATALRQRLAASHQRGPPRAAARADHGGWDRARARACSNKLSTRAGENGAP